jgi:hypothetical protein
MPDMNSKITSKCCSFDIEYVTRYRTEIIWVYIFVYTSAHISTWDFTHRSTHAHTQTNTRSRSSVDNPENNVDRHKIPKLYIVSREVETIGQLRSTPVGLLFAEVLCFSGVSYWWSLNCKEWVWKMLVAIHFIIFVCKSALQNIFLWRCDPTRVMASSFLRFLHHTQWRTTVGRTPMVEWWACRKDLYLTTHNTHNRQHVHASGGIRTHDLSRRAATDLRLRSRGGHWDGLQKRYN